MQWWTRQQLTSRDPKRRITALGKLAEHPSSSSEALALQLVEDADPGVRLAAIEVLTQLPHDRAAVCLTKCSRHADPAIRERCLRGLASLKDPELAAPLSGFLRDSQLSVRTAAARTLEQLGWKPSNEVETALLAVANQDFSSAAQCGAVAIEPLLAVLADPGYSNRRAVVLALAEIGDVRTTKALMSATRDVDPSVRVVAFEALGDLNEPGVADTVRLGLRDTNANVRAACAESVGRLGDLGAVELLLTTVRDNHWSVRKASVEALGRLKDHRAMTALVSRLSDSDHDVRLAAADALGNLRSPGAIEALIGALIDAHAPVRRAAGNSLRRIDSHWEQSVGAQAAAPRLKGALNTNDYLVRQAAADILTRIGAAAAVDREPAALSHASLYRKQASLEVFLSCLDNPDRDLRLAAVEALGRISDPASLTALRKIAVDNEEDRWVRAAAEGVLPRLNRGSGPPTFTSLSEPDAGKIVRLALWEEEEKQRSR